MFRRLSVDLNFYPLSRGIQLSGDAEVLETFLFRFRQRCISQLGPIFRARA